MTSVPPSDAFSPAPQRVSKTTRTTPQRQTQTPKNPPVHCCAGCGTCTPVKPDQASLNPPPKGPLRNVSDIRLNHSVSQFVQEAENLFPKLDHNLDTRLLGPELTPFRSAAVTPEERYRQHATVAKLQAYGSQIDANTNGIELNEIKGLLPQDGKLTQLGADIARQSLFEPFMVPSLKETSLLSTPPAAHQLTAGKTRVAHVEDTYRGLNNRVQVTRHEVTMQSHTLRMGDQKITIDMPVAGVPEGTPLPTLEQIAQGVARMPVALRANLERVVVNPYNYRFAIGEGNDHKADMTAGDGLVTLYAHERTDESLTMTLLHELGHVQSFAKWSFDSDAQGWQQWREAMAKDGVAPSRYARENASEPGQEDFAEATVAYFLTQDTPQHQEFKAMFPARFAILEQLNRR